MTGSHRSEDARFKLAPLSCRYPHRHGYSAPLASFSGNRGNATPANESISASRASLREVDLNQVQAASFADALDGVSASVFFVDAHARVAHANIAGHAMLEAGDVLCSVDGRLVAID